MLDPLRLTALEPVRNALTDVSNRIGLEALPFHAHEVLFAIGFYAFITGTISPAISRRLFPETYGKGSKRLRINWDIHVVSFVQSVIVNIAAFYVIFCDEERKAWRQDENWHMRIWGYSGASGLLQSFAVGYFLFDFYLCVRYIDIFGIGMVVHAVASSSMFMFGFRPFIHFYCPVYLLHELSTPFLNIHWFCDKLKLTGSIYQAANGAILIFTFFACRIAWGTYSAVGVSRDVYRATFVGNPVYRHLEGKVVSFAGLEDPVGQTTAFLHSRYLPVWLGVFYIAANVSLTILNCYWFSQMIKTLRTRFEPPLGTKKVVKEDETKKRR